MASDPSCKCGHPKSWHQEGGHCTHGCGCEQFHGARRGRMRRYVSPPVASAPPADPYARLRVALVELAAASSEVLSLLPSPGAEHRATRPLEHAPAPRARRIREDDPDKLGRCERAILNVLAQRSEPVGRERLAILAGYNHAAGGFGNALGKLRGLNLARGSGSIIITPEGASRTPKPYDRVPQGTALAERWAGQFGRCARLILLALAAVYPRDMTRVELAENAGGYDPDAGGFGNALGELRGYGLVERRRYRASDDLMQEDRGQVLSLVARQ